MKLIYIVKIVYEPAEDVETFVIVNVPEYAVVCKMFYLVQYHRNFSVSHSPWFCSNAAVTLKYPGWKLTRNNRSFNLCKKKHRKFAAIIFSDFVVYTAMMAKNEENAFSILQKEPWYYQNSYLILIWGMSINIIC